MTLAVVSSCGERGTNMRYYLVADDGDVILESIFESYAVQGQLAASGSISTPSPIALDVWRLEAGSHFFQVSTFNQSGEPYVVAELSWPVLSYWKEQINDGTMTLQKLHARHPTYAADWLDENDSAAERDRVLSNVAVRRDLLRDEWMLDLTYEEYVVRVPNLFGDTMPEDAQREWFTAQKERIEDAVRSRPAGA
jgi:hypothetical protein